MKTILLTLAVANAPALPLLKATLARVSFQKQAADPNGPAADALAAAAEALNAAISEDDDASLLPDIFKKVIEADVAFRAEMADERPEVRQDLEIVEKEIYHLAKAAAAVPDFPSLPQLSASVDAAVSQISKAEAGKFVLRRLLARAEAHCDIIGCGEDLTQAQEMVRAALSATSAVHLVTGLHLPADVREVFPDLYDALTRYNGLIVKKREAEGVARQAITHARDVMGEVNDRERPAYDHHLKGMEKLLSFADDWSSFDMGEFDREVISAGFTDGFDVLTPVQPARRPETKTRQDSVEQLSQGLAVSQESELAEIVVSMMTDRVILLSRVEYALGQLELWYQEKQGELSVAEQALMQADENLEECAEQMTRFTRELIK